MHELILRYYNGSENDQPWYKQHLLHDPDKAAQHIQWLHVRPVCGSATSHHCKTRPGSINFYNAPSQVFVTRVSLKFRNIVDILELDHLVILYISATMSNIGAMSNIWAPQIFEQPQILEHLKYLSDVKYLHVKFGLPKKFWYKNFHKKMQGK